MKLFFSPVVVWRKAMSVFAAGVLLCSLSACLTNPANTSYYEQRGWDASWWETAAPSFDEDSTIILPAGIYWDGNPDDMPAPMH